MGSSEEKKKSGLSESFIAGAIAIVFLILGYQTALFIHQAAVMKIAANRDEPDTVYIHVPIAVDSVMTDIVVKKNAVHTPRAEAVRVNVPRKKTESFRFDPNTVSVDDMRRLGFSPKQAQSIDNYRKKGGRFRRKSDFAKSYVVSDSVFRRLEPYIDIPLVDLNTADSAAFDALPGIGGWFASKIITHRQALGGYSYKEQLMDIYRFDQEKFEALQDLVTVSEEYVTPYPIWSLPADSLRLHPYIRNYETAKAIVLYRENTPPGQWTVEGLHEAGILTDIQYDALSRCIISVQ
jgi:DNA uptake protein ComE-like DNA-binding protein